MLRTTGTLNVKRISQSRNGPFCVADLITEFGEFKVKDPLLDQFDEGQYRGTVWISQIYLSQYIDSYGRAVTELRARLDDIQIDTEADLPAQPDATIDIDPVEEAPFKALARTCHKSASPHRVVSPTRPLSVRSIWISSVKKSTSC